nr:D-alanyl-D-alanine carboxypeptidase [uncultured Marvinbryantia sp.]
MYYDNRKRRGRMETNRRYGTEQPGSAAGQQKKAYEARRETQRNKMQQEAQRNRMQQEVQRNGMRQEAQWNKKQLQKRRSARIRTMLTSAVGVILAALVCLAVVRFVSPSRVQQAAEGDGYGAGSVNLADLYSPYAILIAADTGETLAEKSSRAQIYPASLTKIMTALLVIEYSGNLDETVWIPTDIYEQLYAEGASMAGFLPGEETTLRELLYGILLPSGAECCLTAARYIGGTEEMFAELMNQKAAQIGMENTNFTNCTGLQENTHYSSAADIAILLQYALSNATFREIFTSKYYYVQPTEQHPDGFTFWSTLFSQTDSRADGVILGGKTGYTEEAGLCLASLLSVGGREYILVTAGAPGSHETEPYHIEDALNAAGQLSA